MSKTATNNSPPGREWLCSLCGHTNVIGWDRSKLWESSILPLLTGERMLFFCMNCDKANFLQLVGHFVNLNESSETSNRGGCPAKEISE